MHRLAWLTDIHLEFTTPAEREALKAAILAAQPDSVVITGDIAIAPTVLDDLRDLAAGLRLPVSFVFGNHDFYHGSIAGVRAGAAQINPSLTWLDATGAVRLSAGTALVGVDGWGDGRLGNFSSSPVMLNDFFLIEELANLPREVLRARLGALGDSASKALQSALTQAVAWAKHVVVATHVPPFREACWHEGAPSGEDWLPFFACKATGDVLLAAASSHPQTRFTVLCGHTHSAGEVQVLANLRVLTGDACYGSPGLQRLLVV